MHFINIVCSYFKTVAKATLPAKTQFLKLESFDKYHIYHMHHTKKQKKVELFFLQIINSSKPLFKRDKFVEKLSDCDGSPCHFRI